MTIFSFGEFRFNSETGELWGNRTQTVLRPQVNKLLGFFILGRDQMQSKEQIMQAIWPDQHVDENAFFQCMNHLRKELGDSAKEPRFIKNFPRKGYRWVAETKTIPKPSPIEPASGFSWGHLAIAAFLIVTVAFGFSFFNWNANSQTTGPGQPIDSGENGGSISSKHSLFELNKLAKTTAANGDIAQCKRLLYLMAALAEAQRDPGTQINALNNLTHIYRFQDPLKGLPLAEQAIALATRLGIEGHLLRSHLEKGFLHLELGEYETAAAHLKEASGYRRGTRKWFVAELDYAHGIASLRNGKYDDAGLALKRLKRSLPAGHHGPVYAWSQLLEATLLLEKGAPGNAKFFAKEAWHRFQSRSSPLFAAKAALLIGQCEARLGNFTGADQWYRQSYDLSKSQKLNYWQAKTALSWAIALGQQGQANQAQTYRRLAKNLLKATFPKADDPQLDLESRFHFFL